MVNSVRANYRYGKASGSTFCPIASADYDVGDIIAPDATSPTMMYFPRLGMKPGHSVTIYRARLMTDKLDCVASLSLLLFNTSVVASDQPGVSLGVDNRAYVELAANNQEYLGRIDFPVFTPAAEGSDQLAVEATVHLPVRTKADDDGIYGIFVTNDAFTPNDMQFTQVEIYFEREV